MNDEPAKPWTPVHSAVGLNRQRRIFRVMCVGFPSLGVVGLLLSPGTCGTGDCDCSGSAAWLSVAFLSLLSAGFYWWTMRDHREARALEYSDVGFRMRGGRLVRWREITMVGEVGNGVLKLETPAGLVAIMVPIAADWPQLERLMFANVPVLSQSQAPSG